VTLGRRDFLQRLSAVLAALGVTDGWLVGQTTAYQQALADGNRCLALLVGINDYPTSTWQTPPTVEKGSFLKGALTDIELQRELLINRFNVVPQDIVTLANADATVNRILETVQGHLVAQAKPGDTVVFHFSGLGSQVHLIDSAPGLSLPTLIAADSHLPNDEVPVLQDLFEESLAQLLGSLRGVKVLTVIDASTAPYPTVRRGNFRVRSRPTVPTGIWPAPFDPQLREPAKSWQKLATDWPGLLLQPQMADAIALEGTWSGFSAGLFTYALTQQIWTTLPSQRQQWFIHRIDRKLSAWTGSDQATQLLGQQLSQRQGLPLMTGRLPQPAADGVVNTVDTVNRSAIVWLGGLPSALLPYCELGMRLQPLPTLPGLASMPEGILVIKTLEGLRAKATLTNPKGLPVGAPVIEIERRFPKEIALTIALDPALERIERVDATSALSSMSFITTTAPGEKSADCLFGKSSSILNQAHRSTATPAPADAASPEPDTLPPGYGLFTPDGSLISGTTAETEEAVKTAVTRLTGKLRSLLAVKMLRLTANPIASRLPVRLLLETQAPNQQLLLLEETLRSRQLSGTDLTQSERLTFGTLNRDRPDQYQIRLMNSGVTDLHYLLVSVIEKSRLSVYCPPLNMSEGNDLTSQAIATDSVLPGGTAIQYPKMPDSTFALQPLQTTEVFAITTTQPLLKTWKAIRTPEFRYQGDRWATVPEPLAMTQALLRDLSQASAAFVEDAETIPDHVLALRSEAWATLAL